MTAFDNEAMKLGLRGITLIAMSGDDGVAGHFARKDPNVCRYLPAFPASSPYVLAVGATTVSHLIFPFIKDKITICVMIIITIITVLLLVFNVIFTRKTLKVFLNFNTFYGFVR